MYVAPMLLQRIDQPFSSDDYICELKIDGIRLLLSTVGGEINLYTRHNTRCNSQFPELLSIDLPPDTILDGEICVTDSQGKPCFESISKRFQTSASKKVEHLAKRLPIQYIVFDIIKYKGEDVGHLPLLERKEILTAAVIENKYITLMRWSEGGYADDLFHLVQQQELEGIVIKRKASSYQIGKRSWDWKKVINYQYDEVFVTGVKKGESGVLIGFPDGTPAGLIEFPFPPKERKALWGLIHLLKTKEDDKVIYLDPRLKIEVKSRGLTKNGYLRIPSFHKYCV
jgi:DNA ligase-1